MSPTKLTEADKQAIARAYRDPQETTTTLAQRFGVSNSTISRLLKSAFSTEEYDTLVEQKKRSRRTPAKSANPSLQPDGAPSSNLANAETESLVGEPQEPAPPPDEDRDTPPARKKRTRRRATTKTAAPAPEALSHQNEASDDIGISQLSFEVGMTDTSTAANEAGPAENAADNDEIATPTIDDPQSWLDGAPVASGDDDYDTPADSIWNEDLDEDEWDEDDREDDREENFIEPQLESPEEEIVEILPLSAASFPRICYLVVDRAGELIVKPLEEFRDLGRLPDAEFQEKTLVVFDNHKVARRYSNNRTQRVVKIPDGRLLYKTSTHLHRKGITRLLMDGCVYDLAGQAAAAFDEVEV